MKKWSERSKFIVFGAILLAFILAVYPQFNKATEPMSAQGMTVEQRATNDEQVILAQLRKDYADVRKIEVSYDYDSIRVYTDRKSTEQYADDFAKEIKDKVDGILKAQRGKLTMEKSHYLVMVFSKDGKVIGN